MDTRDEVVLTLTDEDPGNRHKRSSLFPHKLAVMCHLVFRTAALFFYIFCGFVFNSFIASFVLVILLCSVDFWLVKNVTGRLLVGLRWWNYVDEVGHSHWVYESRTKDDGRKTMGSPAENRVFWIGLVGSQIVWALSFFVTLVTLRLKWIMVALVAGGMNAANLYGYIRCRLGANKDMPTLAREFLGRQLLSTASAAGDSAGQSRRAAGPDFPTASPTLQ